MSEEQEFQEVPMERETILRDMELNAFQLNTSLHQYRLAGGKITDSPGIEFMFKATELFLRERNLT